MYKYGIALSGGGSRGIFHTGVLKALEELDMRPHCFSGTSAGAIVSSLYNYGMAPEEIRDFIKTISVFNTYALTLPNTGVSDIKKLQDHIARVIPRTKRIEDLPSPQYIVATNISKGRSVIFDSGPLVELISISCAIPVVFKPISYENDLYLDGGIMMNMPTKPLRKICKTLIGVNVFPNIEADESDISKLPDVARRVVELVLSQQARADVKRCDLVINSPSEMRKINPLSASKANELFDMGHRTTTDQINNLFMD
jgi:NTE family protein